jgi:hypothetical protein
MEAFMETRSTSERGQLLEQLSSPVPPSALIDLLRQIEVTRAMIQIATGAKSIGVVSNWAAGRSAPRPEHFERLDSLRVVVSFLLRTNALDDDGLAIAMWLNSYPARKPFVDARGRPLMTPLHAIRGGKISDVVDAVQEWIGLREQFETSEAGNWTPA